MSQLLHVHTNCSQIQEKQEKIQQLETKWKEEKKARAKAEDRYIVSQQNIHYIFYPEG